jgi:hypothetical protein
MAHGAAPAVERRHTRLPATWSASGAAEGWRLRRQQVMPGSAAPALLRVPRRRDLAPWRPLAKKAACKLLLFIFPVSDRATTETAWLRDPGPYGHRAHEMWAQFYSNPLKLMCFGYLIPSYDTRHSLRNRREAGCSEGRSRPGHAILVKYT